MKIFLFTIFTLLLLIVTVCQSQTFDKKYPNVNYIKQIIENEDETYLLVGSNEISYKSERLKLIKKVDREGKIIWERNYYSLDVIPARFPVKRIKNGYLIISSDYPGDELTQIILTAIDYNGNIIWSKTISDDQYNLTAFGAVILESGSIILLGGRKYSYDNYNSFSVIKTDSLGNEIWRERIFIKHLPQLRAAASVTKRLIFLYK